jgi:hypothetical protein
MPLAVFRPSMGRLRFRLRISAVSSRKMSKVQSRAERPAQGTALPHENSPPSPASAIYYHDCEVRAHLADQAPALPHSTSPGGEIGRRNGLKSPTGSVVVSC